MSEQKFRLITRADFDGIVSGALLIERGLVDDIVFAEPKDMQSGKIKVSDKDITSNLPYVKGVKLCFDHHASESERVSVDDDAYINDPNAPSAAHVIFEYFGGHEGFPGISKDLITAVDKADSAQFSEEDVLAPDPWTLINFIVDPGTNLSRFEHFAITHEQMCKDLMVYCRHHPVQEIMEIPDILERVMLYTEHEEKCELQLRKCARVHQGHTVVVDLRNEDLIYAGNRFTIYAIFPACNLSVILSKAPDGSGTRIAVGRSIIDRSSTLNVGSMMLEFGGGGHAAAGACVVADSEADEVLKKVLEKISA